MGGFEVDMSEVRAFAADMRQVDGSLNRWLKPAVVKGGVNIKAQLRSEANESRHFRFASAINYDLIDGGLGVEVGPEKGSPGSLGNIAYFGTSRGGGTVSDPRGALDAEAPKFAEALADIAERLLGK